MRVLAWNILRGGRARSDRIVAAIRAHAPDVVVLCEYQTSGSARIIEALAESEWPHVLATVQEKRQGGIAVLSSSPLVARPLPRALRNLGRHYLAVRMPHHDLELRAIYGPLHREVHGRYWAGLLSSLRAARSGHVLAIGDFNSGSATNDTPTTGVLSGKFFDRLPAMGFTDLWRASAGAGTIEHTWQGSRNPYRLDHAFGTEALVKRMSGCRYSHVERSAALSDHSLMLVDIAPQAVAATLSSVADRSEGALKSEIRECQI